MLLRGVFTTDNTSVKKPVLGRDRFICGSRTFQKTMTSLEHSRRNADSGEEHSKSEHVHVFASRAIAHIHVIVLGRTTSRDVWVVER